jgi:hypothetical protein
MTIPDPITTQFLFRRAAYADLAFELARWILRRWDFFTAPPAICSPLRLGIPWEGRRRAGSVCRPALRAARSDGSSAETARAGGIDSGCPSSHPFSAQRATNHVTPQIAERTVVPTRSTEIQRWAYGYWLGSYNGKNMVVALSGYSAYFDASKNKDNTEMLVAGYVSTLEEWAQFEIAWKLTLAKYNVPFFKMSEFIGRKKEYAHPKWQVESYRAQFLSDLAQIIRGWTVASVCCGMKQSLFDQYNAIYELDKRFNTFAICGRDCAAHVRKYIRDIPSDLPIAYIFDQGDEGKGFLMNEMQASKLPLPIFKRSRPDPALDKDDPYAIPLQASDLAAWEIRRGEQDLEDGKTPSELRKSLVALKTKVRIWKETKEPDLQGLIQVAGIKKRQESTASDPNSATST